MDTLVTVQQLIAEEADLKPGDLALGRPLEEWRDADGPSSRP